MPFARASELDRLLACPGSGFLVRDTDSPGYVKPPGAARAAVWGTLCHRWKETGVIPENEAWAGPLDRKIKGSGIRREVLWPGEGEHEVALALNVVTGRAVRCRVPHGEGPGYKDVWKAGFDDQWVTGTLDFTMELLGVPWVDDLKTGRVVSFHDYEAQQLFYCLAWGLVTYERVTETRSTLTHWPRYPVEAGPRRFGSVFDVDYLTKFRARLGKLRDRVLRGQGGGEVKLVTGAQCKYCPSRAVCPELKDVINE